MHFDAKLLVVVVALQLFDVRLRLLLIIEVGQHLKAVSRFWCRQTQLAKRFKCRRELVSDIETACLIIELVVIGTCELPYTGRMLGVEVELRRINVLRARVSASDQSVCS